MMADDLDLFLALAEQEPEQDTGPEQQPAAAQPGEADDLDLFLQLAEDALEERAQGEGSKQQGEPTRQPRATASAAQPKPQQPRLSGWAAPQQHQVAAPGVIPTTRPTLPVAQPRPAAAFRPAAPQQQWQQLTSQPQQRGGGRPGVFKDTEQGSIIERLSGLKIKNPVVSSAQVKARLVDASIIKLGQVRSRHRSTGLEGLWATLCVIGEKSKPRESQNGRSYSIWKVTDLDQASVSLFLFASAHADLWKENVGTLVALFSPKVKTEGDFALSVDSPEQVWVLGSALDFGYCKATKKNGEPCRMPVNASRCPYCPYHVQSEYNKLKPTRRNEFQETNIKTAFRSGMQRGLQWQPGQFVGDGPCPAQARMRVLPTAQLESTAEAAREHGSSTGARYLKTVANPAAVAAASQEREVLVLRRNRLGPGEAPIPLPRSAQVVIPNPAAAGARQAGASAARTPVAGNNGAPSSSLPAKRKTPEVAAGGAAAQRGSGRASTSGRGRGAVLLECDLFEDEARQRAVELLAAMGGAPAPDPNNTRRAPITAEAEVQRLKAARLSQEGASPAAQHQRRGSSGGGSIGSEGSTILPLVQPGGGGAGGQIGIQQQGQGQAAAGPSPAAAGAAAAQVGRLGGVRYNPAAATAAAGAPAAASSQLAAVPLQPSAAAAAVAARGIDPPPLTFQAKKATSNRASLMGKLGLKPGAGGSGGGGVKQAGAAPRQQQAQQTPKSAFEAAFGSVISEMEQTAGAQTTSRYQSAVDEEDHARIDKVLSVLEAKDEVAQKMEAVTKLAVQAFKCTLCGYTAEKRRPECGAHLAAVERVTATKRWWCCQHCKYRFATVGQRYPAKRCAKCQNPQTDFTAVSMYRPTRDFEHEQAAVASRDKLLARGVEQKWVNA